MLLDDYIQHMWTIGKLDSHKQKSGKSIKDKQSLKHFLSPDYVYDSLTEKPMDRKFAKIMNRITVSRKIDEDC